MNPFKTLSFSIKACMLATLALMALASSAAASVCGGKTVYVKVPDDWSTPFYYYAGGGWGTVTSANLKNGWYVVELTGGPTHNETGGFAFAKENQHGTPTQRWIGGSQGNQYNVSGQSPADGANTRINCSAFGSGDVLYVSEDPGTPGKTTVGINPPNAYYFYFYPPSDDKWVVGTPYFTYNENNRLVKERMEIAPNLCGWFRYVIFDRELPTDNVLIYLGSEGKQDKMGGLGTSDPWESGEPSPIDLRAQYESVYSGSIPAGEKHLYYVPENRQWTSTDPGITNQDRCRYQMAAIIYDSDQSRFGGSGSQSGMSPGGPFKCGIYQACGVGTGISKGIADATLNVSDNGERKMKWRGAGDGANATDVGNKNDGWTSENFVQAFRSTPGQNVERCYDMPFERNKQGLWEFDSDRLCMNGQMDPTGVCGGNFGGLMGGFFPNELQNRGDADYSGCTACDTKRQAETWVPLQDTINKWCFDRGWLGTGKGVGNLVGLTSKTAIDAEMKRVCGTNAREFRSTDLKDGDTPGFPGNNSIWNWGQRPGFGRQLGQSASSAQTQSERNLFFCFESHGEFTYEKGQEFFFRGDDDIWVFINDRMVIDLGGSHLAAPGYVLLDTISTPEKLEEGQSYPIDIFFCDSRSTMSNVRVTTNIYFSQSSGWKIDKPADVTNANICLTVTGTSGACGGGGGGSREYCGSDLGPHLEFYMQRVGSAEIEILNDSRNCRVDGEWLVCYDGIKVDMNEARARIEKDKIKGLSAGTYKIEARIKPSSTNISQGAGSVTISQFSIIAGIELVWGRVERDGGGNMPAGLIRNLRTQNQEVIAGKLVPVGFAAGNWEGNTFFVSMDPEEGSPGKTIRLDQTGLTDPNVNFSELKIYSDSLGTTELSGNSTLTIPRDGPDAGLLVLWVTGEYRADDDATYKVNIAGKNGERDVAKIEVYLPRFKFVESAASTDEPLTGCKAKGSDNSRANECPNISAKEMEAYTASPNPRTIAAYHRDGNPCDDCNMAGSLLRTQVRKYPDDPDVGRVMFEIGDLKNGIAEFSFIGMSEVKDPPLYFTIGGPSSNLNMAARWDSLYFAKPLVPVPVLAEIFDRSGDGIGDELHIHYDVPLTKNGIAIDSIPNYIEVFWDYSDRPDIIGYGGGKRKGDGSYGNDDGNISKETMLKYWTDNHSIVNDSIIVIKRMPPDSGFSRGVKTSVGPDKSKIFVQSWASFTLDNGNTWKDAQSVAYIKDKIPPIVVSAKYERVGGGSSCGTSEASTCRDRIVIALSEPVKVPEGGASENSVKTGFAYWLKNFFCTVDSPCDETTAEDSLTKFEVHGRDQDLPRNMTWAPNNRNVPSESGDSIVTFLFSSYKSESDGRIDRDLSALTPVAADWVKLAAKRHGVDVPAILDLEGNPANENEKGRPIEGNTPAENRPIRIAEVPSEHPGFVGSPLYDKLKELGLDKVFEGPDGPDGPTTSFGWLPVPESWYKEPQIIKDNYPGSVGMVFMPSTVGSTVERDCGTVDPKDIKFYAKTFFHTNLGNFVVDRELPALQCDDPIFNKSNVPGVGPTCKDNNTALYVAWNLKDAKNRWAGVGAYVGIYDFYWTVDNCKEPGRKVTYDKTEKKVEMFGVTRAKKK